ncbi:MAG TPA: hypothetical protein VMK12_32235 [Anaeromyxobacteraceae bacterium]|nr:hypothetical protein [Anaeromyxobacteraceae bacterium]
MTNAVAHVGFSLAIPLLGEHFWGRKGLWISGLSWIGFTLLQESLFHAPPNPGPDYPAEVRSDLITRLIPCATLLAIDALAGRHHAATATAAPTPPGRASRLNGLEFPSPLEQRNPERSRIEALAEAILRSPAMRAQPLDAPSPNLRSLPAMALSVQTTPPSDSPLRDGRAMVLCTASLHVFGVPSCSGTPEPTAEIGPLAAL